MSEFNFYSAVQPAEHATGVYPSHDLKVLVLYGDNSTFTPAVYDHLDAFRAYLPFEVHYANAVLDCNEVEFLDDYDVIIVHYSCGLYHPSYFSQSVMDGVRRSEAFKIVFAQDEYDNTNELIKKVNYIEADLYYTCVPTNLHKKVFKNLSPNVKLKVNLTGYITTENTLLASSWRDTPRPFIVSYRGRPLHPKYGSLGYKKWKYGLELRDYCDKNKIPSSIEVTEEARLYWGAWRQLLRSSVSMLITPSGSAVFDFDGEIRKSLDEKYGDDVFEHYEEVVASLADVEANFSTMAQISPKFFECMAGGCIPLVTDKYLPEDFIEFENYIPVEWSSDGINEAISHLADVDLVEKIKRNNLHIAANGKYSYRNFIANVEADIRSNRKYSFKSSFITSVQAQYNKTDWLVFTAGNEELYSRQITRSINSFSFRKSDVHQIRSVPSAGLIYHLDVWTYGLALQTNIPKEAVVPEPVTEANLLPSRSLSFKDSVRDAFRVGAAVESQDYNHFFRFFLGIYRSLPANFRRVIVKLAKRLC